MRDKAFVHIIESPSDEDMLDGRTEGKSLASLLTLAGIPHCYNLVATEKTLRIALYKSLPHEIEKTGGKFPILHFSMHGNPGGIGLTDNRVITWDELCHLIMPVQQLLQEASLDLLICMSSCHGSFGSQMAQTKQGYIPFKFLIGNRDSVPWDDAAVAYKVFYHLLFKGLDLNHCYEVMQLASHNNKFEVYNGQEVHLNWINYNQQIRQRLIEETAQRLQRRRIIF
ncbi:hypothetical protein [Nostoc sp. TCL240-02]|uniref:hypothetical protein n=1 Tax=Nostoc sp. TCL240-02 TaxID=2572090 RepID=UPI00157FAE63|nr:hypothetical protein [Nostoc sp. TCL240-02]QKQ75590.1 hypothetical protein FBB35_21920 [Nostoc sp. TCL240-02]